MNDEKRNELMRQYNELLKQARRGETQSNEIQEKALEIAQEIAEVAEGQLDLFKSQSDQLNDLNKRFKDVVGLLNKIRNSTGKIFENITKSSKELTKAFSDSKDSLLKFVGVSNPLSGISDKFRDARDFVGGLGDNLRGAGKLTKFLGVGAVGAGIAFGGVLAIGKKLLDQIKAVDEATAQLVQTTGILDASFSKTLIQATESSSILGGNIQLVGEYAAELIKNLSPAISLTSELVGNVAQVGERFQIGADNASKLTQIISELTNTTFEEASGRVEGLIESTGRLGIAVARDLAESYDSVIDRFGIGLESLKQQTLQAVQLGLSISKVADISEQLLDFQSSISSEFKASAILGQQVNLQKARQLAFEGNIVGALNETLDRVEEIGDFEKLNFFQRKAIAEATGLSVSELQKELNLRRQIGVQGRIDEATRATALGKFEEIQRRIQAVLFKVLASPNIQQAFDNFANAVIKFLQSPRFNQIINSLGRAVDFLGNLLGGGKELKFNILQGTVGLQNVDSTNITQQRRVTLQGTQNVDDAVITPQGDVIRTNPRDFIIATQTPQTLIQPTENSQMMGEMVSLLRELKQNGVQSVVNLDGKRVSTALTNRIRY